MLLRPRQKLFVERCVKALDEHGNTIGIGPTGAGKTLMLSAVAGEIVGSVGSGPGIQYNPFKQMVSRLASIEDVVQHYSALNEERLHADGERILRRLDLTLQQVADLAAFLRSLSR